MRFEWACDNSSGDDGDNEYLTGVLNGNIFIQTTEGYSRVYNENDFEIMQQNYDFSGTVNYYMGAHTDNDLSYYPFFMMVELFIEADAYDINNE